MINLILFKKYRTCRFTVCGLERLHPPFFFVHSEKATQKNFEHDSIRHAILVFLITRKLAKLLAIKKKNLVIHHLEYHKVLCPLYGVL